MKRLNTLFQFGILLLIPLLNSCLNGDCTARAYPPTDVTAVAGDGSVTLSWHGTGYPSGIGGAYSEVRYPRGGGSGETCADWGKLKDDCTVGCNSSRDSSCTITGLTNGTTYTFTVISLNSSMECEMGVGYARAQLTPTAN